VYVLLHASVSVFHLFQYKQQAETFAKPDICRTRAGGCPVQSSALLVSHISENKKFSIKSKYLIVRVDGNYLSDS
jgi:hypothetical protein